MKNGAFQENLKSHVIAKIEYYEPRAIYPRLHGKNAIKGYHGFGGSVEVVKIITDKGDFGWGSLCRRVSIAKQAESSLLGKKLTDVFNSEIGILDDDLLPFDIALHDLAGRILNIPVCQIINSSPKFNVKIYDAAIYMNDIIPEDNPFGFEQILQECADDYALGHRAMKIKIGRSHMWMEHDAGLERDIEIVKAIAERFPDVVLMVDANDGYSVEDCCEFLKGIGNVSLYWFEEPFLESVEKYKKLREFMNRHCPTTLLADGETRFVDDEPITDIPILFELAEQGLLDVWQPDVCDYGFTAWRKLMPHFLEKGYLGAPHAWGQILKTHYSAHLAAAFPHHMPYVEGVPGITEGVDHSGYKIKNGILEIPQLPGFGMELIWAPKIN